MILKLWDAATKTQLLSGRSYLWFPILFTFILIAKLLQNRCAVERVPMLIEPYRAAETDENAGGLRI